MKLVFVHGAGCTGDVFAAQTRGLPDAVALTLPGHTTPGAPASIEAFADAVAHELDARGINDAVLCGHSMGGAIALELALRAEPRVRAVVMLSSGARLRVAPAILDRLEADFEGAAHELAQYFYADPTPERLRASVAMMHAVGQAQTLRDFRACDAFNRVDRLEEVALPLLALTGERDLLTPPKFAVTLADRVPGASARIVPGAGHLAMAERPGDVNDALRAFVNHVASTI
ncbi:MAG TPA: alpha/beta fold hydrolase [Candidatus Acidoferrum sp.]|nr:alpha/beta fold hydrolase [Candidatus Acidoferrum sp.]